MLQKIKLALACLLLASLAGVAVQAVLLLQAVTHAAVALPLAVSTELQETRSELMGEIASTRKDLTAQVEGARKEVLARAEPLVAGLRTDTVGIIEKSLRTADRRIGDTLARVDTALGTVEALRADLRPALTNTAAFTGHLSSITAHVDDALPAFTDCAYLDASGVPVDGNPDCAFNRFQGASKSFETAMGNVSLMSGDFRAALPAAITTWQGVGANVNGITDNVNRLTKPKWYDRLLGYGFTGAAIWRDLNPTANFVTGITRVITTQH